MGSLTIELGRAVIARYGLLPIVGVPTQIEGRGEREALVTLRLIRDEPLLHRRRGELVKIVASSVIAELDTRH